MRQPLLVVPVAFVALIALLQSTTPLPAQDGGLAGVKFGGRRGGPKPQPDPATVAAIRSGLKWLVDHQNEDGSFDPATFMRHDTKGKDGNDESDGNDGKNGGDETGGEDARLLSPPEPIGTDLSPVGATGLVLLALSAEGNTARHGEYRKNVERALRWFARWQDESGGFQGTLPRNAVTEHAIATFAVTEAAGLVSDPALRALARAAVERLGKLRGRSGLFGRSGDAATSHAVDRFATFWAICALLAAKQFEIDDGGLLEDVGERFRALAPVDAGSRGASNGAKGSLIASPRAELAAEVLCRLYLGEQAARSEPLRAVIGELTATKPAGSYAEADILYWSLGSQALYQVGGEPWSRWTKTVVPRLIAGQSAVGVHRGSWDPVGPDSKSGGRVYATVLAVRALQPVARCGPVR